MLASTWFIVLAYTFRSLIHFEFLWCEVQGWKFIHLHVPVLVAPAQVVERPFSPIDRCWHLCQKSLSTHTWIYFWILCSVPLIKMSVLSSSSLSWWLRFVESFEILTYEYSNYVFSRLFWVSLQLHTNFQISLSFPTKKPTGMLMGIALGMSVNSGSATVVFACLFRYKYLKV